MLQFIGQEHVKYFCDYGWFSITDFLWLHSVASRMQAAACADCFQIPKASPEAALNVKKVQETVSYEPELETTAP